MKKMMLIFAVIFVTGCETTVKFTDVNGVETKMSETAYLAMKTSEAITAMGVPVDACANVVDISKVAELTEAGEVAFGRALEMCNIRAMVGMAMGLPSTAQGQVAAANTKAIISIENGQASKVKSAFGFGAIGVGAYFTADIFSSAFAAAGSNYNVGDINMSNSGESTGGEGGDGQAGDRNMALAIGGTNNFQPGDSNTQATAEKATSVDNPIVSGGPGNTIVNDSDGNDNDGRLF